MRGTLSGYYNTSNLLSGVRLLIKWLLYALKQDVNNTEERIERKKARFTKLTDTENIFDKTCKYVAAMDDETFILDFISVTIYLRAGFNILPTKPLYYDEMESSWAYIYPYDNPYDCSIFNTKENDRALHAFNHCRPFDIENWHVMPFSILHELSHLITMMIDPAAKIQREATDINEKEYWGKISKYASTNYAEYCAETLVYVFSNADYIPKKYLQQLPKVSDNSHPEFTIPYSNLLQNGYISQYDINPELLTPEKILQDLNNIKKHPRYSSVERYEKELKWAKENFFCDASANLALTLICWYLNKVYDLLPAIKLHNLSLL